MTGATSARIAYPAGSWVGWVAWMWAISTLAGSPSTTKTRRYQ